MPGDSDLLLRAGFGWKAGCIGSIVMFGVKRAAMPPMSERAVGVETICRFCSSIKWRSKRR